VQNKSLKINDLNPKKIDLKQKYKIIPMELVTPTPQYGLINGWIDYN